MLILDDLKQDIEKDIKELEYKKDVLIIDTVIENLKEVNNYFKNNDVDKLEKILKDTAEVINLSKEEYEKLQETRKNIKIALEIRKLILQTIL